MLNPLSNFRLFWHSVVFLGIVWTMGCFPIAGRAYAGEVLRHPKPTAFWMPLENDPFTTLFFSFDTPPASVEAPASPLGNDGAELETDDLASDIVLPTEPGHPTVSIAPMLSGNPEWTAEGFSGGGMRLHGGKDSVRTRLPRTNPHQPFRTFEFRARFEAIPQTPVCLFECAAPGRRPVSVNLHGGEWEIVIGTFVKERITATIIPGRWTHYAVQWGRDFWHLHIDGKRVYSVKAEDLSKQPPVSSLELWSLAHISFGNNHAGTAGLVGTLDDIRISMMIREFYLLDLAWVDTDGKRMVPSAPPFFRDAESLWFHAGWNGTLVPETAAVGTMTSPLALPDESWPATDERARAQWRFVFPEDGVERQAFRAGQAAQPLVYTFPEGIPAREGTLALWLRPANWDNADRYGDTNTDPPRQAPVFELRPVDPQGKPAMTFGLFLDIHERCPAPLTLHPGVWHHVAVTWEGRRTTWFVNGKPWPHWGTWAFSRHPWEAGRPQALVFPSSAWHTIVDDLRIFSRALSASEIMNLAAMPDTRTAMVPLPPLDLDWKVNGVTGDIEAQAVFLMPRFAEIRTSSLALLRKDDEAELVSTRVPIRENGTASFSMKTDIPFGDYVLETQAFGDKGDVVGQTRVEYTRVRPAWWEADVGRSDRVMPGWEPVRVDGQTAHIVLRAITFGESGLPSVIESNGGDVLAAPMTLMASAGGQPLKFVPLAPVRVTAEGDTACRIDAAISGGGVRIDIVGRLEYDGFLWYSLTIESTDHAAATTLDRLELMIPYREESAAMGHWWSGGAGFRSPKNVNYFHTPEHGEEIFRSNHSARVHPVPEQRGSFIPYLMLTGDRRGMAWFAENDRGWTQSKEVPAIAVRREPAGVVMRLAFVPEKTALSERRVIEFGLHVTPIRKPTEGWRRTDGWGVVPDSFSGNILKGSKASYFHRHPEGMDWDAVQRRLTGQGDTTSPIPGNVRNTHWRALASFRKQNKRDPLPHEVPVPALYIDLQRNGDGYPDDTKDWAAVWQGTGGGKIYNREYNDYCVWIWNEWVRRKIVRGFYMDDCFPVPMLTPLAAESYVLPDGHRQPGFQWRGYRDQLKRLRQVCVDHGIDFMLAGHTTHTNYAPYHAFFDVIVDGEDFYRTGREPKDFMDCWPPHRLRFMHPDLWGMTPSWLLWYGGTGPKNYTKTWIHTQLRAYTATMLLHDLIWSKHLGASGTSLDERFFSSTWIRTDPSVRFVPYWDSAPAGTVSSPDVRMTAWCRDGAAVLVAVNLGASDVEATLTLDLPRLGFSAEGAWRVRDLDPAGALPPPKDAPLPSAPSATGQLKSDLTDDDDLDEIAARFHADKTPPPSFSQSSNRITCRVGRHDYRLFLLEIGK